MSLRHWFRCKQSRDAILLLTFSLCVVTVTCVGEGFQPILSDELKLTTEPLAPGAPAIILYRQVDRDDSLRGIAHEYNYLRIKILTEQGRKYGDIQLPYFKEAQDIVHIGARTIRPDGSIINFDGQVFDKQLVKGRRRDMLAKTFTLPQVQVGSIIEYFYTVDFKHVYDSHWILSEELFTRTARFSLKPYTTRQIPLTLRWSWQRLPAGCDPPKEASDQIIRMEAKNIPGFQIEDLMPPANELKSRVDFIYETERPDPDPDKFWRNVGKSWNDRLEKFVGKRDAMQRAMAEIVAPNDLPEAKLRKIYDRVQLIRNKSYEIRRTEQEQKRDKERANQTVEDVWKHQYGDGVELTWLYLALVRAAGFEAYGCWISSRSQYFFTPVTMESAKLRANVVLVKLNGKDQYFDPGAEFTPFGMLTWSETGVPGLRLDNNGGSWIRTSLPKSSESRIERTATLKLSDTGDLEGKAIVTYTGLEAMYHRLEARDADEITRKKFLEDQFQSQIPVSAEAELTNKPDWKNSETPLVAEFALKIPGWGAAAGKRAMLPVGIFSAREKHMFEHGNRVHPVYIEYPVETLDDVTIELPPSWQVSSLPPSQENDSRIVRYALKMANGNTTVHVTRQLDIDFMFLEQKYYGALRSFFEAVRTGDEEQIVLHPATATAKN